MTDSQPTGRHRRPESDETDAERTQRHPALQQVVDDWLTEWPSTDPDRS
ncbi:hypothetical protein [Kutzneria buriramensis]|nr:hypothetical protein [Kutzneria buriramensis]